MIKLLHSTFNRQIDRQEAKDLTIGKLLNRDDISTSMKETIRNGAQSFLIAWKMLRSSIEKLFVPNILDRLNLNNRELNRCELNDIKLSYLLSSCTKDGRYIYALIFYMAQLQNDFLQFYKNRKNEKLRESSDAAEMKNDEEIFHINKIDIRNVQLNNCISFERDKEFLKLIYINSNYSLGANKNLTIEYNYSKIQSSIEEKILNRKCFIDNKVHFKISTTYV